MSFDYKKSIMLIVFPQYQLLVIFCLLGHRIILNILFYSVSRRICQFHFYLKLYLLLPNLTNEENDNVVCNP